MAKLTYQRWIPTSRHVVPSKFQRMRAERWIVIDFAINNDEFMEALQDMADSLQRAMEASL